MAAREQTTCEPLACPPAFAQTDTLHPTVPHMPRINHRRTERPFLASPSPSPPPPASSFHPANLHHRPHSARPSPSRHRRAGEGSQFGFSSRVVLVNYD